MINNYKINATDTVRISTSCSFLLHYINEFERDFFEEIKELTKGLYKLELSAEQRVIALRIIYALAKNNDESIEEPERWYEQYEIDWDIVTIGLLVVISKILKNENEDEEQATDKGGQKEFGTADLIASSLVLGLNINDLKMIDIPLYMSILKKTMKMKGYTEDTRKATQEDFDNF